jgi:hypothetical protein
LEIGNQLPKSALDDLDQFIKSEVYDYNSYFTGESKVLINSSKLLILSTFLFKILNNYRMPEPQQVSGAQTDFKNE